MRGVFGLIVLLAAVAIVGLLAKRQFGAIGGGDSPAVTVPGIEVSRPAGPPARQVEQVRQQVEGLMQQARPMPEDNGASR